VTPGAGRPELHRPLAIDRVGPRGFDTMVDAGPVERAALAERLSILAVLALRCRFHLTPAGRGRVEAMGHLEARVVQTCVVTLDEFEADIEERFGLRFVPAGTEATQEDMTSEVDEIPITGSMIDLGEEAAEQLALALDPYPRKPGASLDHATGASADEAAEPGLVGIRRPTPH
jgi:uncharacterized metal-binding protein YceD (DUF177 family)